MNRLRLLTGMVALFLALAAMNRPALTNPSVDPAHALISQGRVPARVVETLRRSCYDCHSNETRWPWYARMPVTSWVVARDVRKGRGQINFSTWTAYNRLDRADKLDAVCEQVSKGRMPLWQYVLLHRDARVSDDDARALCEWTKAETERLVPGGA